MLTHYDLVLLNINSPGGKVAIAHAEDHGFVPCVSGFGRKAIRLDLAIPVAVDAQPTGGQADLPALRIKGVTDQSLAAIDLHVTVGDSFL